MTRITSNLLMAIQTLAAFCWMGLLYLVKGVLLVLEWAFSLDLLGDSLSDIRGALLRLHHSVLGEPWVLAAVAIAGLWALWRGLIQRRTTETVSGLAATVGLMVCALVVINSPVATVGYASRLSNEAALGLLSAASTGTLTQGPRALSTSQRGLFDSLVLRPWCALEFADLGFCLGRPPKDLPDGVKADAGSALTVADLWLRYPAGGDKRNEIYEHWRGDGQPLQPKVQIQKEEQTQTRIALILLIALGVVGALLFLFWLGLRLLAQAVLALVLLLAAPAMLLAPALGDAGRSAFIAWGKRLLVAILSKAVYALLLALVLVAANLLAEFRNLGFIPLWLLQIVFWWGLFLRRAELTGFLSVGRGAGARRGIASRARSTALALAAGRSWAGGFAAPARAAAAVTGKRNEARKQGTQAAAHDALAEHADGALRAQLDGARATLERDRQLQDELKHTERFLSKYDKQAQLHKAKGLPPPSASEDERAMLSRREALRESRAPDGQLRQAGSLAATADRNLAIGGREFTDRDREGLIEQRRRDLDDGVPVDHERNLRFAGIDPDEYWRADPAQRGQLDDQARRAGERDSRLLAAVPPDARLKPSAADLHAARIEVPPEQVKDRVRREHAARRVERRERKRRDHVYRSR